MKTTISYAVAAVLLASQLGACASPARTDAMIISATSAAPSAAPTDAGYRSLGVRSISGGGSTNPLWLSNVDNDDFRTALEESLRVKGYLAADSENAPIKITVTLVDLQRPLAGLNMNVSSRVRYVAHDPSGRELFDETIAVTGRATVGEQFAAVERLRVANERSIQANIDAFITRLSDLLPARGVAVR